MSLYLVLFAPVGKRCGVKCPSLANQCLTVFLAPLLALLLSTIAAAQVSKVSATLEGTLADSRGAVIPGAEIKLRNIETNQTRAVKTDAQVLGPNGVVQESRATVVQLNAMLGDARATLKKVDGVLAEAQSVAANARVATTDLGALRSEVDATMRKVEQLVDEVNRKWPFARDVELRLK